MKIDCIFGIDPGANGGIAVWQPGKLLKTIRMPRNVSDIRDFLQYYHETCNPIVFLEKLSVRPDDVSVSGGKANMGKLYRIQRMIANYEELKAAIEISGIPFVMVHPMKWQNALKLRTKGVKEEKADRKRRYRDIAGELYPEIKATLWNSDATLIMHFGRYILANDVKWVKQNLPQRMHENIF